MAGENIDLSQLIARACARAVPANKFARLLTTWLAQKDLIGQNCEDEVATAMLSQLISYSQSPPALLLGYLSQLVTTSILSAQTLLTHLLFLISDNKQLSPSLLVSLSTLIGTNIPSDTGTLPATLVRPSTLTDIPDVGTSASAQPPSTSTSTLALLLPLIRRCTSSHPNPAPGPVLALVSRLLISLQPYPAPPLDVGLEAGGLFQSLPEAILVPLRNCLSGLMADLAVSQDANQLQLTDNPPPLPHPPIPQNPISAPFVQSSKAVIGALHEAEIIPTPILPTFISQVPIQHSLSLQLAWIIRSDRWTTSDSSMQIPPDNHLALLRLGPYLASDAATFLQHLLRVAMSQIDAVPPEEKAARWLFVTERLPVLLKWWKENSTDDWIYPDNLKDNLVSAFEAEKDSLSSCNTWISSTSQKLSQQAESDDEAGGFSQPDGWMLCSLQVTLIQRLLHLGLLQRPDASAILPGMLIPSTDPGESLVARIASAPRTHLRALSHIIAYAPGAAQTVAKETFDIIKACPQAQAMEGLLVNLTHEPSLLASIGACINPASWMEIIASQLLDFPDDPALRAENPQDSKSRFGEGAIFAEGFIHHFKLPLHPLLQDARRATSLADLDDSRRSCVNGWIKALFGSEGIDDDIILATSPADFYRLSPSVIQQAILATATGQLDTETLHSGLSYFSQPLLSWSLTGMVGWLAGEVQRNGPISGPYLSVLQDIILSSSFPDTILRIHGRAIADLLESSSGLGPVIQASSFDVNAVKQKLSSLDVTASPTVTPTDGLKQELRAVKALELAPPTWSSSLCDAMERSLRRVGPMSTMQTILEEVLEGSSIPLPQDSFTHLMGMLLAQKTASLGRPLSNRLFGESIPALLDETRLTDPGSNTVIAVAALCRVTKQTLLVTAVLDPTSAESLLAELIDELSYQRARPSKSPPAPKQSFKLHRGLREIEAKDRAALDALISGLGGDEELRNRWSKLGDLSDAQP